jgi:hypothetical protein
MKTIWARYGRRTEQKNQETLDAITPWSKSEFAIQYEKRSDFQPDHIVDGFAEIMEFLPFSYHDDPHRQFQCDAHIGVVEYRALEGSPSRQHFF